MDINKLNLKMINIKNIVRIIVLTPLTIYLIYSIFFFLTKEKNPTYLDCGKVVSKYTDEYVTKSKIKNQFYLVVDFKQSGHRSIDCNPTTYFSKEIGDSVCFNLDTPISNFYRTTWIVGLLVTYIIVLIAIFALIAYILPEGMLE